MNQITEFNGEYRWLSNFWIAPIQYSHLIFASSEHMYQAAKCQHMGDVMMFTQNITPGQAKRLGRQIQIREDWDEIKLDTMAEIIACKFDQHPDLKAKLMATKGIELIEGNHWNDTFWGVCRGKGQNHLGKIIMAYRDKQ